MKINFPNINLYKNNFKLLNGKTAKNAVTKPFEVSSLDILSAYNKPLCFKGNPYEALGIGDNLYNHFLKDYRAKNNLRIFDRIIGDKNLCSNENFIKNIRYFTEWFYDDKPTEYILDLLNTVSNNEELYKNDELMSLLPETISIIRAETQHTALKKILEDKKLYSEDDILYFVYRVIPDLEYLDEYEKFMSLLDDDEILPHQKEAIYRHPDMKEKTHVFNRTIGFENARKIPAGELTDISNYISLINADSVDKLTDKQKREGLEQVVKHNSYAFVVSDEVRKYFPLLPKNKEEYGLIVSKLAQSIKASESFDDETIEDIDNCLFNILDELTSLNDKKFNDIDLSMEDGHINCSNKNIEEEINHLAEFFPELKDDDNILTFLLTVYNISKNPEFKQLSDSDKRIVLLASIFYNLPTDSSDDFDSLKRMNLKEDEKTKLYTLLKKKNWIEKLFYSFVGTSDDINDKLNLLSYGFRFDNTFDLSLILSADKIQKARDDGKVIIMFIKRIKNEIAEFQSNQSFLPVTKFPSSSRINKAITTVNEDGSTNIKGIYKDKDGLIVINYNEVDNSTWEKIGFKRGTISRGIKTKGFMEDINTGNIKFFAHGLDYPDQLANFDAFSLIDSDALLSVSYAERPESKYRFFRPQGIILDVDNINVHSGGESDSGSGYKKTLEDKLYTIINDRKFVPFLLKSDDALGKINYQKFIKENRNKQFSDIYPVKLRNKLIKVLATLNSRPRRFDREYNEFLITNPKPPMAVYAYSFYENEKIDNPLKFLNRDWITLEEDESALYEPTVADRTRFLREYALAHDIPFVVFGECNEN